MENRTILVGDVLQKILEIPDRSIDVVITSPPYWGLRDYKVEGQWGLEPDFKEYLEKLRRLMTLIKLKLKDTGTVWVNLGDTYCSKPVGNYNGGGEVLRNRDKSGIESSGFLDKTKSGVQEKSLMCIPDEFKINCRNDGWIIRNHIPWYKSNSMPSSVQDRFTNKWEPIFFFAKKQKYYFNLDAVREKTLSNTIPFNVRVRDTDNDRYMQKALDSEVEIHNDKGEQKTKTELLRETGLVRYELVHFSDYVKKQDRVLGADGKPKANYKRFNERWNKSQQIKSPHGQVERLYQDINTNHERNRQSRLNSMEHGKNPGDVFFINPRPFPEAHFATFPVDLPLKILKCACPPNGIVLDPFFGAGTVGIAAEKLGLKWIGIEIKQEYVDMARKRLDPYMNEILV